LVSLVVGPRATLQIPAEVQRLLDESVLRLETLLMKRFSHLNAETCHLYAVIFSQIRQALLSLAFSSATPSQEQIIKELKTNLFRYLEPIEREARRD
jgi:hypothetical protein